MLTTLTGEIWATLRPGWQTVYDDAQSIGHRCPGGRTRSMPWSRWTSRALSRIEIRSATAIRCSRSVSDRQLIAVPARQAQGLAPLGSFLRSFEDSAEVGTWALVC